MSLQTYPYLTLHYLAISNASSLGKGSFLSFIEFKKYFVISLPAKGICFTQLAITAPSLTGKTWVTPSPESTTIPVISSGVSDTDLALGPAI